MHPTGPVTRQGELNHDKNATGLRTRPIGMCAERMHGVEPNRRVSRRHRGYPRAACGVDPGLRNHLGTRRDLHRLADNRQDARGRIACGVFGRPRSAHMPLGQNAARAEQRQRRNMDPGGDGQQHAPRRPRRGHHPDAARHARGQLVHEPRLREKRPIPPAPREAVRRDREPMVRLLDSPFGRRRQDLGELHPRRDLAPHGPIELSERPLLYVGCTARTPPEEGVGVLESATTAARGTRIGSIARPRATTPSQLPRTPCRGDRRRALVAWPVPRRGEFANPSPRRSARRRQNVDPGSSRRPSGVSAAPAPASTTAGSSSHTAADRTVRRGALHQQRRRQHGTSRARSCCPRRSSDLGLSRIGPASATDRSSPSYYEVLEKDGNRPALHAFGS